MTILFPALVALLGLLCYIISSNPKINELGRIAFFCGLLVTTFVLASQTLSFLRG
jgi:Na+/phosphate symporter